MSSIRSVIKFVKSQLYNKININKNIFAIRLLLKIMFH
jgi:hypothetical protein